MQSQKTLEASLRLLHALGAILFLYWIGFGLLFGCAAKKPLKAEVTVKRPCIVSVALTPETECHGKEGEVMTCKPLKMEVVQGCETISAPERK